MKLHLSEIDCVFISYDEPNAEKHYADLLDKCIWAKRVHGVKGSDECHKAAAEISETEWLITVDADNIVKEEFFDQEIEVPQGAKAFSWPGVNVINGLRYGNGSLKVWHKDFILNMRTHEASETAKSGVDFCWEEGYYPMVESFSTTYPNASPYQAWRAGFREGVKMSLVDGILPSKPNFSTLFWHNQHRLSVWSSVGAHVENGLWAILGARHGCWMTNCTNWNWVDVRDFSVLEEIWQTVKQENLIDAIDEYGEKLKKDFKMATVLLDKTSSQFVFSVFAEQAQQIKEQILWTLQKTKS